MKKKLIYSAAAALCLLLGFSSCNSKPANQDANGEASTEQSNSPSKKDIFFYTNKHRADAAFVLDKEKVGFGSQILSINEGEFKDNKIIKEVWIAPQIEHIANKAFAGCTSLEKVHFQGEVKVINDDAFEDCAALKNLNVDVYTIGVNSFKGCTSLETARFGEHLWWIRVGAFYGCSKLRRILMGIAAKKLDDGAFDGCTGVEEFSIPNDFKNRMFGLVPSADKWKKIYLLSTEYYAMPKNCTPNSSCTLYVPDAFLSQFKADPEWMKFGSIKPLSSSQYFTAKGFWK